MDAGDTQQPTVKKSRGPIRLRELGFPSVAARRKWLDEHGQEIADYARTHGHDATKKEFHVGSTTIVGLMHMHPSKESSEAPASTEPEQKMPPSVVDEIGALFDLFGEQVRIRVERIVVDLEAERIERVRLEVVVEDQKDLINRLKIMYNEALARSRVGKEVSLGQLQKALGRNQMGRRISKRG